MRNAVLRGGASGRAAPSSSPHGTTMPHDRFPLGSAMDFDCAAPTIERQIPALSSGMPGDLRSDTVATNGVFRQALPPVLIGMPQMGPCGLSENWLLRYLGDVHWQIICDGLNRRSRDMVDDAGNRLYASFARVRWSSTVPLSGYRESDNLTGTIEMLRFGGGVFVSTSQIFGEQGTISATLASIFTRREGILNDRLVVSAPPIFGACPIPNTDESPAFLEEHRSIKAGKSKIHRFMDRAFETDSPADEVTSYQTNGYQDFNGANLLYFVSYPTIADICVSRTSLIAKQFGYARFVEGSSPLGRDIFYFGNANLGDWISCGLKLMNVDETSMSARVDLVRAASGALIGKQFVARGRP
jgi:probable biosynthetic protein (TIGR04098 family)